MVKQLIPYFFGTENWESYVMIAMEIFRSYRVCKLGLHKIFFQEKRTDIFELFTILP